MDNNSTNISKLTLTECQLENEKRWGKLEVKLKELQDTNDVMFQRLNKQAGLLEDIQQLSNSVAILAENMKSLIEEQQKTTKRLDTLEAKPAKRWDSVVDKIIMLVIAALVSAVLIKLGFPPS